MAGFNFTPPPGFQPPPGPQMMPFNPQQALQAFRPPPPMNMGGMGIPQQQQGGFGMQQGAGMLSGALSGFKGFGDGLPQSGLGTMTGNAAQNAVDQSGAVQLDPSGFNSAFGFLSPMKPGVAGLDSLFSGMPMGGY